MMGLINCDRIKQVIVFDGLQYGSITPTDIDGCIEYKDKAVIFLEYKYVGNRMPDGQRLCLERLADDVQMSGREAVVMLCEHEISDVNEPVDAETSGVVSMYYCGKWHKRNRDTVGHEIEKFLSFVDGR